MGKFSDRVRAIINPAKQKLIEFNRRHGLNDDARIIPQSQMRKPHDAYFIRLVDNPDSYVKFKDGAYFYAPMPEMACLWDWKTGNEFIKNVESPKLEMVRLDQVIK
jgi:hypothetical protein